MLATPQRSSSEADAAALQASADCASSARAGKPYVLDFAQRIGSLAFGPYIDVQVVDHCNLGCRGCLHFAPLAKPRFLDLAEFERDLGELARIPGLGSYLTSLALMGGEPLLHPRLPEIVRMTRSYLPDAPVMVASNGLLLKRMGDDFWEALSGCDVSLVLSPYPLKVDYPALVELAREHGVTASFAGDVTRSGRDKEAFFQLALDPDGAQDPVYAFNRCPFGGSYLLLGEGRLWPCQVAARSGALNAYFGTRILPQEEDSLALADIASVSDLDRFRRKAHPMCRFCDNDKLTVVEWGRSKRAPEEWLV